MAAGIARPVGDVVGAVGVDAESAGCRIVIRAASSSGGYNYTDRYGRVAPPPLGATDAHFGRDDDQPDNSFPEQTAGSFEGIPGQPIEPPESTPDWRIPPQGSLRGGCHCQPDQGEERGDSRQQNRSPD